MRIIYDELVWSMPPTLLNGVPVPVIMTVSVTFELTQGRALGASAPEGEDVVMDAHV